MDRPKISVVIPCYNRQSIIPLVIQGLLCQTIKPDEIIVVDDASTDNTLQVLKGYNIKVISNKNNLGPAASRNRGFLNSQGDLIVFIDSDALPKANLIEVLLYEYSENKNYHKKIGGIGGKGIDMIVKTTADKWRCIHAKQEWGLKTRDVNYLFGLCSSYPRKVLEEVGGFDEFYRFAAGEDVDLGIRIRQKGYKLLYTPQAITFHYHSDTSFSLLRIQENWTKWNLIAHQRNRCLNFRQIIGPIIKPVLFVLIDIFKYHDPSIASLSMKVFARRLSVIWNYFRTF
ncbi:MAG TPA: hypothetical protein DCE76_02725 [Anaerolineaceae bacterium]|nr:hypothetical protein [Anaerolineaceae bacterium]